VLWFQLLSRARAARPVLFRERVRIAFERMTGTVLVGLGLRVAFSDR